RPAPGDVFLEVGPGRGALTVPLASSASHVVAFEIDRDLINQLSTIALAKPDDCLGRLPRHHGRSRAAPAGGRGPGRASPASRGQPAVPCRVADPVQARGGCSSPVWRARTN